jgi:hypothetical protein
MSLLQIINELKSFLDEKKIDRKQFAVKLDEAIENTVSFTAMAHDLQGYYDAIAIVANYIAGGDKVLAELIRSFLVEYMALARGLLRDEYKRFKEMVMFYLQS